MSAKLELEALGRWMWGKIGESHASGLPLHEESLTQFALARLFKSSAIHVLPLPKHVEAKRGWDYDFFLRTTQGVWIYYAIQAKRAYGDNTEARYSAFKPDQHKLFLAEARRRGAYPLYGLYNCVPSADQRHWHCKSSFERDLLSLTVAPAWHMTANARTFEGQHSQSRKGVALPIRCLLEGHPTVGAISALELAKGTRGRRGRVDPENSRELGGLYDVMASDAMPGEAEQLQPLPEFLDDPRCDRIAAVLIAMEEERSGRPGGIR